MARIEQVREGEVPAELAGLYRDVRQVLRTSYVPLLFRLLAPEPAALKAVWRFIRPAVATKAFEEAADDLRAVLARTAVELGTPLIEPVLASAGLDVDDLDDIRGQLAIFHYTDPKLLLCVELLQALLAGETVGGRPRQSGEDEPLGGVPREELPALLPEEPDGTLGRVFHDILDTTHLPIATVDLRALGRWPSFLETAWHEVGPIFRHRALGAALEAVDREGRELLQRLPHPLALARGAPDLAGRELLARVVHVMGDALPRLALFASALKVALDGVQDAMDSPYPVDWGDRPVESLDV
jgi:hypothetical protein